MGDVITILRPGDRSIETRPVRLVRLGLVGLFLFVGIAKLVGWEAMTRTFEEFGYSEDLMLLVGVLETLGAVGLLVPALVPWAALGLCGIRVGAIVSHLVHDPPYRGLPALALLLALATIAWRRFVGAVPPGWVRSGDRWR